MLAKCSTRCPSSCAIWSVGQPWYLDTWNVEKDTKALELFQKMQKALHPDPVTYVGVLNACASVVALEEGEVCAHEQIIQSNCESAVFVRSSLVDMYAKCGSIEDACRSVQQDAFFTWCGPLECTPGGFAMHRHFKEALMHFEQMCEECVQPDDVTFVCLLWACSNAGFLWMKGCTLCFDEHSLHDSCKIGTL